MPIPGLQSARYVLQRSGNCVPSRLASIGNEKLSEFLAKAVATALHDTAYMCSVGVCELYVGSASIDAVSATYNLHTTLPTKSPHTATIDPAHYSPNKSHSR